MKFGRSMWLIAHCLVFGAGCGVARGPATKETGTESTAQWLEDPQPFLYFRSNASGWDPSPATLLRPGMHQGTLELDYRVTEPWMVESGDDCGFVETPQRNGWGDWQNFVGSSAQELQAPARANLRPYESRLFRVRYPKTGGYRLTVDVARGTFSIAPKDACEPPSALPSWVMPACRDRLIARMDNQSCPNAMTARGTWEGAPLVSGVLNGFCRYVWRGAKSPERVDYEAVRTLASGQLESSVRSDCRSADTVPTIPSGGIIVDEENIDVMPPADLLFCPACGFVRDNVLYAVANPVTFVPNQDLKVTIRVEATRKQYSLTLPSDPQRPSTFALPLGELGITAKNATLVKFE